MRDPYERLGLDRSASAEDIKRSYRRLAKKLHPDLNPGDRRIEQQFKEITAAYELLSDPAKRARFDRGEIDADGAERGFRYSSARQRARYTDDLFGEDPLSDFFRPRTGGGGRRGGDVSLTLKLPFLEAVLGTRTRIGMADGRTLEVTVPAGIEDRRVLRLKGQGNAGIGGGPAGDALIEIAVEPHPVFSRENADIHSELPVSLPEALLGARVTAQTIFGPVSLKVPPG